MRILITGSSGFIGGWLLERMKDSVHEVYGLDKRLQNSYDKMNKFYHCDILDIEKLRSIFEEVQPDVLVHLAARTDLEGKTLKDYDTNIQGVRNLCELVNEYDCVKKAIYTSSMLVCKVGYVPENELDYCPNTPYGESKVLTEKIVHELNGGGVPWCIVRPTTAWGPRMSDHYQTLLRLIKSGRFFHSGNSKLFKSYVYVENICYQYKQIIEAKSVLTNKKTFYLADYSPLSLRDYTNLLAKNLGGRKIPTLPLFLVRILALTGDLISKLGINFIPFNSFRLNNILTEYIFDTTDTQKVCGELPYTFEEGVEKTAAWYLQNS